MNMNTHCFDCISIKDSGLKLQSVEEFVEPKIRFLYHDVNISDSGINWFHKEPLTCMETFQLDKVKKICLDY